MKIATVVNTFLCASALSLAAASAHASMNALDKPFNENHWVTTHNSYEKINQNLKEMPQQLKEGVRGFMLDLYVDSGRSGANRIKVCHKTIACYGPFSNHLKNEFIPFLKANPTEVVTVFLETYVEREDLQQVFDSIPELGNYSFNPANFPATRWPTPKEMAAKNNRLILMTDKSEVVGDYNVNGKTVSVLFDKDWIVQNHWDTIGAVASSIEKAHDWSCPTRWSGLPLVTGKVASSTQKQWPRLFLMNQFHTVTSTIPDSASYDNNLTYLIRRAANCEVKPNFVGINNYKDGDAFAYTKTLSEGGIYLWEGSNADKKQDAVCAIPAGKKTLKFPTQGCENDEAKSMSISGLKKGTRITVFDNGDGNRQDDYTVIDIKRNIGTHEDVVLGSFETNVSNNDFQVVFARNNGLDGKVSRLEISETPTDFSDAAIAMYEGNNASQNLDCTVPFTSNHSFGMKSGRYGCSNDEIKSAKILKAKAGTSFIVRGHPGGDDSQGKAVVTIKRDIHLPVVVGSFNSSFENADIKVVKTGSALDGKISHGAFNGAR
ncbi:MAG TPA: hypothetical protein VF671_07275 [Pseudomonas sp.]|uniref:hypothetical protein n=1 Tax=Pseudomonas sp. TaxID=306 RepID=UPI002ED8D0B3